MTCTDRVFRHPQPPRSPTRQRRTPPSSTLLVDGVSVRAVCRWLCWGGGVTPEQMAQVRPRLESFAERMLGPALRRAEQRINGELYLRGLLTDGARKSMQPMAERLGVDHQRLQQFVSSSTWDYTVVRATLARWAMAAVGPHAYVVDDVGFPKDGDASPG